jgi:FtsP/CotA-like multicopper oxidase with cupredoxin domain/plastocyanin
MTHRWVAVAAALVVSAMGYGLVPSGQAVERGHHEGMTLGHVPRAKGETNATVIIGPRGHLLGFDTPNVSISPGGSVKVINREGLTHTFTSVAVDADGDPLFDVVIPPHATRPVPGVDTLKPGKYKFFCRIHPNMRGSLTVLGEPSEGPTGVRFDQPLRLPPVLTGRHIVLPVRRTLQRVLPHGALTPLWTYGGSFPGPTIVRPAGRDTRVTVINDLPRRAGALSLHFHGDHHAARHDGQPDDFLVRRGERRTYDFPLTYEGRPARAAFEWYHDHRMNRTSPNIWRGLAGAFIVTSTAERRLDLPSGRFDVPLVVSDRSFGEGNTLAGHFHSGMVLTGPEAPPNDATVGSKVLVDGQFAPYFEVAAHRYRLRLLNASNFSSYNFALSDGQPFVQIGTGNGLLEHPVKRRRILLGPAQRVDVLVDFRRERGQRIVLESVARSDAHALSGIGARQARLMQFRVTRTATDHTHVPWRLSKLPPIKVPDQVAKRWVVRLVGDEAAGSSWTLNGRVFDPDRVDHFARLGSTELWELRNDSSITHFIHLHEELWHTISRDGHAPPPWERLGLEDTWRLDPGETVLVAAKFSDYTGRFMVHCHMLDHEDHGLMSQFAVTTRGAKEQHPRLTAHHPEATRRQDMEPHHTMIGMAATAMRSTNGALTVPPRLGRLARRAGSAIAVELLAVGAFLLTRRRFRRTPA